MVQRSAPTPPEEGPELAGPGGNVRLFVHGQLAPDGRIALDQGQSHYLIHVMRCRPGNSVAVFNGRDGEWRARIDDVSKRGCTLVCEAPTAQQDEVPDLWLAFAPIKKIPAEYLVQKATELGVRVLQPVLTARTIVRRVNEERLLANAVEAAEQSGRMTVPGIRPLLDLPALIRTWPADRTLMFCDEQGDTLSPITDALMRAPAGTGPWGILTGPEGGFDDAERDMLRALPFVMPVALGRRILRADTAALGAIAVWQAIRGDWR